MTQNKLKQLRDEEIKLAEERIAILKKQNQELMKDTRVIVPVKGRWYWANGSRSEDEYLILFNMISDSGNIYAKCFIANNFFSNGEIVHDFFSIGGTFSRIIKEATEEEIKSALIKEAEKQGFKIGTKFIPIGSKDYQTVGNMIFDYYNTDDLHIVANFTEWDELLSNPIIYSNGQWAEIVKEEPLVIGGHEVKFAEFGVYINDYYFSTDSLKRLSVSSNVFLFVFRGGLSVTMSEIKQILKRMEASHD